MRSVFLQRKDGVIVEKDYQNISDLYDYVARGYIILCEKCKKPATYYYEYAVIKKEWQKGIESTPYDVYKTQEISEIFLCIEHRIEFEKEMGIKNFDLISYTELDVFFG